MTQLKDLNLVKVFKTAEFGITPKINREIALWISKHSPIILSISSTSFNKGKNNSDVLYLSIIYKLNTDEMAPELLEEFLSEEENKPYSALLTKK